MKVRVGLMGFGRVGRNIFRILRDRDDIEVAAVSDIADPKSLEYLLKYDTIMGRYPDAVSLKDGYLYTRGKQIKMLQGREPGDVDWTEHGVDVVVEATARYRTRDELTRHLEKGAKRVVLCVPPLDEPDRTVVVGVNHKTLTAKDRLISAASITANCLTPVAKAIHDAFFIERLFFTTIHAYTNDQRLADVPADDMRRSRAASENIIPTDTNAGRVLTQIMPHLEGKVSGMALKVPVPNGSVVDLVCHTKKDLSVDAVNEVMRTAADSVYKGIVAFESDPIVSSDVKHSRYSCNFDSLATMVLDKRMVKTISWYDNGWGYANRVIDLIEYLAGMEGGL